MRINSDFYRKNALDAAKELLGKLICREMDGAVTKLRITQTEAYYGFDDTACHAHKGKTDRNQIMFYEGGYAYIYLCYGIHSLLNVVTGEKNFPEAVLIRGVEGFEGPGKLTKALCIDKSLNGESLVSSTRLWLEDDGFVCGYETAKRVGIDYATEEYRDKLWRFIMK